MNNYNIDQQLQEWSARSLLVRGQEAFLDIRVFDPNTNRHLNATLPQCHETNMKEKNPKLQ